MTLRKPHNRPRSTAGEARAGPRGDRSWRAGPPSTSTGTSTTSRTHSTRTTTGRSSSHSV
eukprot:14547327-Alexandrium_andersonii.AAC.1